MKLKDYEAKLQEEIAVNKAKLEILRLIDPVMRSLNGKAMNQRARIAKALKAVLPDHLHVSYDDPHSWFSIKIWDSQYQKLPPYDNCLSLNCGYRSETDTWDYNLVRGARERPSGGTLGNQWYWDGLEAHIKAQEIQLRHAEERLEEYHWLMKLIETFNRAPDSLRIEVRS